MRRSRCASLVDGFSRPAESGARRARSLSHLPDAIAEPGEASVLTLHAEGAQVYECKADPAGRLVWEFREPVATLIEAGKTVATLRRTALGARGRQCHRGEARRARTRCFGQRHPAVEAQS